MASVRYKTLDIFRGLAALGVTVFHGFGSFRAENVTHHPSVMPLRHVSDIGWVGVHLFFVISGFCISSSLVRCAQQGVSPLSFLTDRFLRIYPTYWAACLISIFINFLAALVKYEPLFSDLPKSFFQLLGNILLIEPYVGVDSLLLVSWTLVYEMAFYTVGAVGLGLYQLGLRKQLLFAAAMAFAVVGCTGNNGGILMFTNFWGEFLAGSCVYLYAREQSVNRRALCLLIVLLLACLKLPILLQDSFEFATMIAYGFAVTLCLIYPFDDYVSKAPPFYWLRWLGRFSFSLYLTHVFLGLKLVNLSSRWVPNDSIIVLPVQIMAYVACVLGAYVFYILVENRFEDWRISLRKKSLHPTQSTN